MAPFACGIFESLAGEGLAFVGSPASVAEQIRKQRARIGYDILLTHHHTTMPEEKVRESQRLFGEAVIPSLRDSSVSSR
jgi:alkanesulfonate monooxygenase SsuD/methylene tetrahydromethanopterin reductase-like flavin-dependent oxidoreductase (luciferase family)